VRLVPGKLSSASESLSLVELELELDLGIGTGTMTLALLSRLMPVISHSGSFCDPMDGD